VSAGVPSASTGDLAGGTPLVKLDVFNERAVRCILSGTRVVAVAAVVAAIAGVALLQTTGTARWTFLPTASSPFAAAAQCGEHVRLACASENPSISFLPHRPEVAE